jgi:DNA-directed RNA polymerase subunit RPC12/RpoP
MMIKCIKCSGRVFVDRVYLSNDHLELVCINCGKRDMFHPPEKFGKLIQWIMKMERDRAERQGTSL